VNIASKINLQNRIQDTGAEMKEIATKLEISEAQKAKMEAELKNLKQQLEIILKTVSKWSHDNKSRESRADTK